MHIGDNIKRIRKTLGYSQDVLADKSGVSKSQISRIEKHEQNNPQIETVIAISTALCISIEELVFGDESQNINYLTKMLETLKEDDQKSAKKFLKGWILACQSEMIENEE